MVNPNEFQLDPVPTIGEVQEERNIAEDVLVGTAFGLTESVRSAYNLLDFALGDSLKDWSEPIVDRPHTLVGSLVGGLAQFALPYIGITRFAFPALGRAAYWAGAKDIPGLAPIANQLGRQMSWLSGNTASRALEKVTSIRASGDSLRAAALFKVAGSTLGKEAIRGGVTDFVAFDGQEARFADILQRFPETENAFTEWLAYEGEDGFIEGRVKNVVEGAILGTAVDSLMASMRSMRAYTRAKGRGASEAQARGIAAGVLDESIEGMAHAQRELDGVRLDSNLDQPTEAFDVSTGQFIEQSGRDVQAVADETVDLLVDAAVEEGGGSTAYNKLRHITGKNIDPKAELNELNAGKKGVDEEIQRITESQNVQPEDIETTLSVAERFGELQRDFEGQGGNPRELSAEQQHRLRIAKRDANLTYLGSTPEGFERLMRAAEQAGERFTKAVEHTDETLADALMSARDMVGMNVGQVHKVIDSLPNDRETIKRIANKMVAYRMVMREWSGQLLPIVRTMAQGEAITAENTKLITANLKNWMSFQAGVTGLASEFGAALRKTQIMLPDEMLKSREVPDGTFKFLDVLTEMTPENLDPPRIKLLMNGLVDVLQSPNPGDNLKAMQTFLDAPRLVQGLEVAQEWHINALLSGASTHVVNFMSGLAMSHMLPIEKMLGGWLDAAGHTLKGDLDAAAAARLVAKKEAATLTNLYKDVGQFYELWKAARQGGVNPFDAKGKREGARFSRVEALGTGSGHEGFFAGVARAIDWPGRVMADTDSALRIWNGRAKARGVIHQELLSKGVPADQIAAREEEMLSFLLKQRGQIKDAARYALALKERGIDQADDALIHGNTAELLNFDANELNALIEAQEASFLRAKEVTFTTELDPEFGVISRSALHLQKVVERNPVARMFVPFVRTPTNIAEYTWDHTIGPILGLTEQIFRGKRGLFTIDAPQSASSMSRWNRMLFSPDAGVRAQAKANLGISIGTMGVVYAALESMKNSEEAGDLPLITGKGPTDPDVRAALQAAGWQPYSIRVGDTYRSYQRLDPFSSVFLGISVDMAEYVRENFDEDNDSILQATSMGMVVALANNITNKTYMQGLTTLLELITEPAVNVEVATGRLAGSFIPSYVASTEAISDPVLSEVRSVADRLLSRLPHFSGRLDPRRDLLGEPIKREDALQETFVPIRISRVKDKKLEKELARFSYGFSMPGTTRRGVDLLQEQHVVDNQTAYDRFVELSGQVSIGGKTLRQELRRVIGTQQYQNLDPEEGPSGERSERITIINGVLRKYRARAWKQLIKERPGIQTEAEEVRKTRDRRRRGLTI